MTIAIGILVEVVLMILFCRVEVLQRKFFHGQRLLIVLLLLGKHLLNDRQIRRVSIIDTSTIASALVVSLLVETGGVDGLEKHLQQELETDHIGIEPHKYRLSKARLVGIDLLISRILRVSVGESHFRDGHALNLLEVVLRSPEAAPGKVNILRGLCFQNPVYLMLYERTGLAL